MDQTSSCYMCRVPVSPTRIIPPAKRDQRRRTNPRQRHHCMGCDGKLSPSYLNVYTRSVCGRIYMSRKAFVLNNHMSKLKVSTWLRFVAISVETGWGVLNRSQIVGLDRLCIPLPPRTAIATCTTHTTTNPTVIPLQLHVQANFNFAPNDANMNLVSEIRESLTHRSTLTDEAQMSPVFCSRTNTCILS